MIKLRPLLQSILLEEEDYRGQHEAPDKTNGAPLYDLTKIYPDDIYSSKAAEYYGTRDNDGDDQRMIAIFNVYKNKPHKLIKVYRAAPKILNTQNKIGEYEQHLAYIMKNGKLPRNVSTSLSPYQYYDSISDELAKLKATSDLASEKAITINPGDWVTPSKKYAIMHGKAWLRNKYRIISKTVPAKTLYTTADSIYEFGYDP